MPTLCKTKSCPYPRTAIMRDKDAPVIKTFSLQPGMEKFTGVVYQASIYSAYCYYHHKVTLGLIRE